MDVKEADGYPDSDDEGTEKEPTQQEIKLIDNNVDKTQEAQPGEA